MIKITRQHFIGIEECLRVTIKVEIHSCSDLFYHAVFVISHMNQILLDKIFETKCESLDFVNHALLQAVK